MQSPKVLGRKFEIIFSLPVKLEIIHGNNEDGIDIYVDLMNGKSIRFAMQVKTYGDICKSNFNESVFAQIGKTTMHSLDKLVFVFAADLTVQENKISHTRVIRDILNVQMTRKQKS